MYFYIFFATGIPFEQLSTTGIELKRSSMPVVLKPFLENVLLKILAFEDKEKIDQLIIDEIHNMKYKYGLQEIAIPCGIKDMDDYTNNLPIHVRGARIWNTFYALADTDKILAGKIKYIYVKKWDNPFLNRYTLWKQINPDAKDAVFDSSHNMYKKKEWIWNDEYACYVEEGKGEYSITLPNDKDKWDMMGKKVEVDYNKMVDLLIINPVNRFYESLKWNMPVEAVSGNSNNIFGCL